jgi:Flp pilus assembly protein TadG
MGRTSEHNIITQMENGLFFIDEIPVGTVNGSNTSFTLTYTPNPTNSLNVYVNGQRLSVTTDFTLSGATLTLNTAPITGSILVVEYHVLPATL